MILLDSLLIGGLKFVFGKLAQAVDAELDAHLRREQLFAERGVVVQLRLDSRRDLVENEPDAADQERVEDDHSASGRQPRAVTGARARA